MPNGTHLRTKRNAAEIAGSLVCLRAGIARSRLSDIERGYVTASDDEIARIDAALDELTRTKRKMAALAAEEGWPSSL
jgi:transcriptional regulator with XRE-family HTH domain